MAKNTDVIDFQSLVASFNLCGEKLASKFDSINDIEYIIGTQTQATGSWTGNTKSTSLYAGKIILYKLPYSTSGNASLNLTFPDGSKSGAKAIYRWASTRLSTQYGANYYIPLIFNGTYWFVFADYDTNYYDRLRVSATIAQADGAIKASCLVGTLDGINYKELKGGSTFDLRYPYFYNNADISDGQKMSTSLYIILAFNIRLFFDDDTKSIAFPKPFYLKGTLTGNIFTVHPDLLVEEPTTSDNYDYLRVGSSYSVYQLYMNLFDIRIYKWVNGVFQAFNNTTLKSLQDYQGQQIDSTYIKNISNDHGSLTVTKGNNTTQSITLQVGSLDTVPATINGSMWFEIENDAPVIKFTYNSNTYLLPIQKEKLDPQLTLSEPSSSEIAVTYEPHSATVSVSYLGTGTISVISDLSDEDSDLISITYDANTKIITIYRQEVQNFEDNRIITFTVSLSATEIYKESSATFQISIPQEMRPW